MLNLSLCRADGFAYVPLEKVVKSGELIVVGTLTNVKEYSDNTVDIQVGELTVYEVLAGKLKRDKKTIPLVASNPSRLSCPRLYISEAKNKCIWVLNYDNRQNNLILDDPNQQRSLKDKPKIEELIRSRDKAGD